MRPLEGLRRDAQLQDAIAVLPRRVGRIPGMREPRVGRGKGVVGPRVREPLLGPGLAHDLDGLAKELAVLLILPRVGMRVELRALVGPDAAAEADVDPASREVVQDGQVLRQPDGMPPGRDVRHLPDPDPAGPHGQVRSDEDGIGQVPETVRAEVVLPHPHRVVAELLGQDDLLPQVVEEIGRRLGAAAAVVERGEEAEPHQGPPAGRHGPLSLAIRDRVSTRGPGLAPSTPRRASPRTEATLASGVAASKAAAGRAYPGRSTGARDRAWSQGNAAMISSARARMKSPTTSSGVQSACAFTHAAATARSAPSSGR